MLPFSNGSHSTSLASSPHLSPYDDVLVVLNSIIPRTERLNETIRIQSLSRDHSPKHLHAIHVWSGGLRDHGAATAEDRVVDLIPVLVSVHQQRCKFACAGTSHAPNGSGSTLQPPPTNAHPKCSSACIGAASRFNSLQRLVRDAPQ